ncbi:hypothetical protein MUK71_00645 [Arthrobacter zhangbolii]|uniref:Uncharacterized protein n=1 Tax=Arthrobacter zhangbolii TaxID=2886936 RepID=A0A9X1M9Y1_9MICC|nr:MULTISPECIES: hypothetical protein [Arthrobacter]MCC3274164.1 hypothetical protein [Arthrobacter zhangbolii]MCC3294612.1 hypothetical protein [Arthrobacter zhangbolii]MDN3902966.1 hypothetical protein [Arthrobacter sp. YD2]UON92209.1 hypothetical protein MUK71_00645 [Arthrobacter zhangbolii]
MSLATTVHLSALAVSGLITLTRLPQAIKGRNPLLFWALLMLTVAIALANSAIYLAVDNVLGGINIANLIIRFAMYGFVLILGLKASVAFRSPLAGKCIGGSIGLAVLGVLAVLMVVLFVLADMPSSSPGLRDYAQQLPVILYTALGRAYPAYVSACLIGPAFATAAHRRRPALIRTASALIALGLSGAVLYALQDHTPWDVSPWDHLVPYSALISCTLGLALLGGRRMALNREEKQTRLTQTYVR